jgi:hypothetical protein
METRNAQTILNEVMAAALVAPEFCPFEALHDTAEYKAADRANDAKRMIDLESAITTPTHITFKTGARSSHKVRNIRARLEKFAGIVRTGAKLFGGGLDKPARKPTPAVIWPAGKVKLLSEMFEDKQYTDALAMGEDELGAVFYSYDAGIYDNGSRVFMAWAPMEVDGMPEGFASVKTSDGYFRVIHALSGRSVGNGTKARNSAIFSAIESWNTMSEEKQAQALVNANARLNNCELSRAAWVEFHQIDDARAIQARITEREQMDAEREALRASRRHGYDEALVAGKLRQAQAAQDVAQVVAGAQAMAAIEQASESSALQELASDTIDTSIDTSADQAACQADDVQELAIVGGLAQQAGQQEPGASGGNKGNTSTTNTSSVRLVASGTRGQSINSKSGAWSALFFVSDSGAPSMEFKQAGRVPCIVEFESGRDRMRALQQSAKWADEAAARQADTASVIDQSSESAALQSVADVSEATTSAADEVPGLSTVDAEACEDVTHREMSNAGGSTGATGHSISTTYINGDEAEYTGKSSIIHGKKFHEVRFLEGHKSGQTVVTMRAPDGSGLPACAPTSSGIVTPQVPALQTMACNADQAARDAARVCTTPPASQAPEQTGAVLNSETPQDQAPVLKSKNPQDQVPEFDRVKPFNCDPAAMLDKGIKPEQLVGMGVNYTGNMASPDGEGAGNQGGRSADDSTPGITADGEVDADEIQEMHPVRNKSKLSDLVKRMKANGWQGRPVLSFKDETGIHAVTGSHRIAAARKAGISVPYVLISDEAMEYENENSQGIFEWIGNDDDWLLDHLIEAGDTRAVNLMKAENQDTDDDGNLKPDEPTPPASHAPENTTGEHHENTK